MSLVEDFMAVNMQITVFQKSDTT